MRPHEFEAREKELLVLAKQWMPRLPFEHVDLLFIDEIGKNISGTGMDTNVVGRKFHVHTGAGDEFPKVKRIVIRGLTEETHGNASGIGMAEFCTQRAVRANRRRGHADQLPDRRPRRGRHDAVGLSDRPRDARRGAAHDRPAEPPTPSSSGFATRSTWAKSNARQLIWTRPGGATIWRSSREPRELPFDAARPFAGLGHACAGRTERRWLQLEVERAHQVSPRALAERLPVGVDLGRAAQALGSAGRRGRRSARRA